MTPMADRKIHIVYVTSSEFKRKENEVFAEECLLGDGTPVHDRFEFEIRSVPIKEILEVNIETMVMEEVTKAYSEIKVPCIVEHAGLIFDGYDSYPGGLTKPMWNALKERFIDETHSAKRPVIARAVVAYCDGKSVKTFVGETTGAVADSPRGKREFYWDTIFVPDDPSGKAQHMTYAEIVDDTRLGLKYKVVSLSQSSRAMLKFLAFRSDNSPDLWSRIG
jgi:inosine/xanthosine triphosphate pyrophosphatase family protein